MLNEMMMAECNIDILTNADGWPDTAAEVISNAAHYVWTHVAEGSKMGREGELSITLSDNDQVQSLNNEWRGKDKPTNVLSFAAEEGDGFFFDMTDPAIEEEMKNMPRLLGDIVLALETVIDESNQQNKEFNHHLTHLVMHGVLHLLGYDHIEEDEATEMEALEASYLAVFGIEDPYIEGATAPDE